MLVERCDLAILKTIIIIIIIIIINLLVTVALCPGELIVIVNMLLMTCSAATISVTEKRMVHRHFSTASLHFLNFCAEGIQSVYGLMTLFLR